MKLQIFTSTVGIVAAMLFVSQPVIVSAQTIQSSGYASSQLTGNGPSATSLSLPPGGELYVYGATTGGAYPMSAFANGQTVQITNANGNASAELAVTTSPTNQYTTATSYNIIAGIGVSGFNYAQAFYEFNPGPGPNLQASVSFTLSTPALVVVMGMGSSQPILNLSGLNNPTIDVAAENAAQQQPSLTIEHAYLSAGTYTIQQTNADGSAAYQTPGNEVDLIGVLIFSTSPNAASSSSPTIPIPASSAPATVLVSPADGALNVSTSPSLNVEVSDPSAKPLTVTFYGQLKSANAGPDFTIVVLPDTQFYSHFFPSIFTSQTDWITNNCVASNIVYVAQLGDCVDDGDVDNNPVTQVNPGNNPSAWYHVIIDDLQQIKSEVTSGEANTNEWAKATNALYRLETPTPGLPYGIPYGVAVGNHDEDSGQGHSASDSTTLYNQFVGTNHFKPKSYYGGNYGADGDNFYDLFSASGMDFIVLYLQYDETMTSTDARLTWANNVLQTYSNRRAIVVSHWLLNDDASFGFQGANIYDALKGNTNLFLMLCGHISGWTRTSNVFNGNTIWTVLSDYQSLDSLNLDSTFASTLGNSSDNGDGWLRIYTFSPSNNVIHAQTYSPFLSAVTGVQTNMSDRDNEFNINYNMSGMWVSIATNSNVTSGSTTSAACPCLTPGTQYQWYVTVSDGQTTTKGPLWTFTATTNVAPVFQTVERTGSVISLAWGAIPGRKYQLQYSTDLSRNNWTSLGGANAATTSTMSATDSSGPDTQRFYRVVLLP